MLVHVLHNTDTINVFVTLTNSHINTFLIGCHVDPRFIFPAESFGRKIEQAFHNHICYFHDPTHTQNLRDRSLETHPWH